MDKFTFKVTDNSINRKGVRILTQGIDSTKYNENNVILFGHNHNKPVGVGNYYMENDEGFVDVYFDEEDKFAMTIAKKVIKKHLRTTSIAIAFSKEDIVVDSDGIPNITKSELREISIVAVPANTNATLQQFSVEEIKENNNGILYLGADITDNLDEVVEVPVINLKKEENNMIDFASFGVNGELELKAKFEELTTLISSVKELEASVEEKTNIIVELNTKSEELEASIVNLNEKLNTFVTKEKLSVIENAIKEGKFNEKQRDSLIQLSEGNFELVKEMIENAVVIKAPSSDLKAKLDGLKTSADGDRSTWTFGDWTRKDYNGLSSLKENSPEEYSKLYKEYYNK